jgi:hypothetical protein
MTGIIDGVCGEFGDEEDIPYTVFSILGWSVFGILLAVMAANSLAVAVQGPSAGDAGAYNVTKTLLSAVLLPVGAYALRNGLVLEGSLSVLFAVSCLGFSLSELLLGTSGYYVADARFGIFFLTSGMLLLGRRDIMLGSAVAVLSLAHLLPPLLPGYFGGADNMFFGVMCAAAAALMTYVALGNLIFAETGRDVLPGA